jgi:cobalt/nickel transport system permease protein
MHMSDALISPAVGGAMWVATAGLAAVSARRVDRAGDDRRVPLMGVLGAFVFATQMVNFSVPGTGSSGHLGGGLLLAVLIGPTAAFLVMASVLGVQALFFADGGLLALGCNLFNLGVPACFVAYPIIFRPLVGAQPGRGRLVVGSVIASVVGLQLGALGVVIETTASGISTLPWGAFAALMLPVQLAIGLVEGLVTAAVILAVRQARPELVDVRARPGSWSLRPIMLSFIAAAILTGGVLSWFASAQPDGLEWSTARVAGAEPAAPSGGVHDLLARVQRAMAVLPGYSLATSAQPADRPTADGWPAVSAGTTAAGLLGGAAVLVLSSLVGLLIRAFRRRPART